MIPIHEAMRIIEHETNALAAERVPLADAPGRVLAESVTADVDDQLMDRRSTSPMQQRRRLSGAIGRAGLPHGAGLLL